MVQTYSLFNDFDIYLFRGGKHFELYKKFGSHEVTCNGVKGLYFAVWAPSANGVSVIGDFNYWNDQEAQLQVRWDQSGIWEGFIPGLTYGTLYKYKIFSNHNGQVTEKADPYGQWCEAPPKTASVAYNSSNYSWQDKAWMGYRKDKNALNKPFAVYEVHLDSWKRVPEEGNRPLSYLELADELVNYVKRMNYTHVEFMPVMEFPYNPSWGYQITGYFAPTARYGKPEELKYLIDQFHQNDIGVILDWVPSHFPSDAHGLGQFDGTCLYEHPDGRKGYHQDWKSLIFNYGRNEVKSFLISNAVYWLQEFHVDGLRVDAVASMLYLDYSRKEGEWEPNEFGGREYLEAISFLKELNTEIYSRFEGVQTIAEESTSFPGVTRLPEHGGLGFGMKWMMGWMHDALNYFGRDTIYRKYHQNQITFSWNYAFSERFMLPLSHDEVVHGKKPLIYRMPGDEWQQFANLRLLYGLMYMHPGAKLIFMGGEFGQTKEWNFAQSLDWHLLDYSPHRGLQEYVADLNQFYTSRPALFEKAFGGEGFEWINHTDSEKSLITFIRKGHEAKNDLIIICNFSATVYNPYRLGVPKGGQLKEVFNSDDNKYYGSGVKNTKSIVVEELSWDNRKYSAAITLPALSVLAFEIL